MIKKLKKSLADKKIIHIFAAKISLNAGYEFFTY